ncbi:hypothetical protein Tco_1004335, partial [Tanacetum coccineum]
FDVLRTAESDSDDEEENEIKRNKFALQAVINLFQKISVWKKAVSFLGSLPISLQHVNWKPDYKGCYTNKEEAKGQWRPEIRTIGGNDAEAGSSRSKRSRQYETVEKVLLPQVHHEFLLWEGCNNEAKSRLGLYHADELDEDGFDVYFQGGLRSDDHFNAQEYWLSISREENLSLSRSHASTIRNLILMVIHKMITYGLCQRTTRYDKIQKNDLWLLSMFNARHQNRYANVAWLIARKARMLNDVVIRSLSTPIYCRDLDMTTLRELIDSEGRLILEDPQPGVPRVGIPRPPRASMQDL